MTNKILILPGDGIGQEVMVEVKKIINWFNSNNNFNATYTKETRGGQVIYSKFPIINSGSLEFQNTK